MKDHPINLDAPLAGLSQLVAALRGENGCPWDRKQTPESMRVYLVEEMYELLEAMESGDAQDVCEELGDVLFQVFFLARIFQERGEFDVEAVARKNAEKMIARHPHVFGDETARTAEDVRSRWHQFKKNQPGKPRPKGALDSVPKSLPALMRAYRICERASRVGFHCPEQGRGAQEMEARWQAFHASMAVPDKQEASRKLGDFLFCLAGWARQAGVHPEDALNEAANRFTGRFQTMEQRLAEEGKDLEQASPQELAHAFAEKRES